MSTITRHSPHVSRAVVQRMARLLYMEYKPSELSEELGVSIQTIYQTYINAGLPHRRESSGRIWIVGTEFREWAKNNLYKGKRRRTDRIGENEGYCMKCKCVREFKSFTTRSLTKKRLLLQGECSVCGKTMSTFRAGGEQ